MTAEPISKICPMCRLEKPRPEFGRDASRRWGIKHICRKCTAVQWKAGKVAKVIKKRICAFCLEDRSDSAFQSESDTICSECLPMAISMGKAGSINVSTT